MTLTLLAHSSAMHDVTSQVFQSIFNYSLMSDWMIEI